MHSRGTFATNHRQRFSPAHAKGTLYSGTFTPSPTAGQLSAAPHFHQRSTAILARFSNSTGLPHIPDAAPNSSPRGLAVRFQLGGRAHTDLIAHSTPAFPARTGAEFLAFLHALRGGPARVGAFLAAHPAARAFVEAAPPPPRSYAELAYFAVSAYKLVDAGGRATLVRFRFVPAAGVASLAAGADPGEGRAADYLREELEARLARGPVAFKLVAQVAAEGDVTDDATVRWPEERAVVELGSLTLDAVVPDSARVQKTLIFDPIPRVQGVEPSDDPLLEMRAAVYLISGKQRRAAEYEE